VARPLTIAIAFEDSPNGVKAAKAAGIFTVAVPME
jgi:beta-phosphoglucomutase-like phosphatase (HAD superfamily)